MRSPALGAAWEGRRVTPVNGGGYSHSFINDKFCQFSLNIKRSTLGCCFDETWCLWNSTIGWGLLKHGIGKRSIYASGSKHNIPLLIKPK